MGREKLVPEEDRTGGLTPMQDGGEEGGKGEWSGVQG